MANRDPTDDEAELARLLEAAKFLVGGSHIMERPADLESDNLGKLGDALGQLARSMDTWFSEVQALFEVTRKINEGLLIGEVVDYVFESFRALIPYERIGLALLEPSERGTMVRAAHTRTDAPTVRINAGYRALLAGSSLERVIETGQPRILNDLKDYLAAHPNSDSTRRIVAEGMRSSLTCPLLVRGRPVGFLFFSSMRPHAYADVHVTTFQQIAGQLAAVLEKSRLYQKVIDEQARSQKLLLNILPASIAERLKDIDPEDAQTVIAENHAHTTVMFADLVGFTKLANRLSAREVVRHLDRLFSAFDDLALKHGVEKIKTIGDAYMVAGGVPEARPDHAAAIVRMALDMLDVAGDMPTPDGGAAHLRIGVHSGPVVAGIIGKRKFAYDLWGDTVNVASRMQSQGEPGRIHVTGATARELGDGFMFEDRGLVELRGIGPTATCFVARPAERTG